MLSGFNKGSIAEFFNRLVKMIDEKKLEATGVFNVDKNGI
jgi:hypothetical protein